MLIRKHVFFTMLLLILTLTPLVMAKSVPGVLEYDGVAVVSSGMWNYQVENCPEAPEAGLRLLIVHGTDDATYLVGVWRKNMVSSRFTRMASTVSGIIPKIC